MEEASESGMLTCPNCKYHNSKDSFQIERAKFEKEAAKRAAWDKAYEEDEDPLVLEFDRIHKRYNRLMILGGVIAFFAMIWGLAMDTNYPKTLFFLFAGSLAWMFVMAFRGMKKREVPRRKFYSQLNLN